MSTDHFRQRLEKAAQALEVSLQVEQQDQLLSYLQQLQRWNKTYNLTALRDPEQMLIQHVFDSLAVVPAVKALSDTELKIVDVGSGGGLPGVVLAVASFMWNVHCVDAVEKKMAFVRQMSAVLGLPNLQAHHQRIEQGEPFNADLIISRAFASLIDFATLSERHLAANGQLIAMKAKHPQEEISELEAKTPWRVSQVKTLHVPELNAERCLVYLEKR